MPFEQQIEELERRRRKALLMGGEKKIKKQHDEGKYTARGRICRISLISSPRSGTGPTT